MENNKNIRIALILGILFFVISGLILNIMTTAISITEATGIKTISIPLLTQIIKEIITIGIIIVILKNTNLKISNNNLPYIIISFLIGGVIIFPLRHIITKFIGPVSGIFNIMMIRALQEVIHYSIFVIIIIMILKKLNIIISNKNIFNIIMTIAIGTILGIFISIIVIYNLIQIILNFLLQHNIYILSRDWLYYSIDEIIPKTVILGINLYLITKFIVTTQA